MSGLKNKIALALLCLIALLYCYAESDGRGDFFIFLSAASDLSTQQDIFSKTYVDGYHYYYSVLFALFLKPFVWLPFRAVKCCWMLLNLFLYCHLFQMLGRSVFVKRLETKQQYVFLGGVFLFSLRFLLDNINHSQITILILWCCIAGLCNIVHHRPLTGGLILALGINIKLLPIVFLPYLLYRGYFKAFGFTILFYAVSLILPSLIIGHEYNIQLLHTWLRLINPTNQEHVLDVYERSFHGLSTLLATLLVKNIPDTYALSLKRNIADISPATLSAILLLVRLALVSFTLFFLKWKPFQKAGSQMQLLTETSYILLLVPLIFPHQQHYAFLFVVPAFALSLYFLIANYATLTKATRTWMIILLVVAYLCAGLALILGEFNPYYDHFKILTYGALLLIPLLVIVSLKNQKTAPLAAL